jgi:hypothetical protein
MVQKGNASVSEVVPTEVYWALAQSIPNLGAFGSSIPESEAVQFPQASQSQESPETFAFSRLGAFDAISLSQDFLGPENSELLSSQSSLPNEDDFLDTSLDTAPSVGFSYHMTSIPSCPGMQSQSTEFSSNDQMWVKFKQTITLWAKISTRALGGNMYSYGYSATSGLAPGTHLVSNL